MSNAKKTQKHNQPKPVNRRSTVKAPGRYGQAAAAIRNAKSKPVGLTPRADSQPAGQTRSPTPHASSKEGVGRAVRPNRHSPRVSVPVRRAPTGPALNHKPSYLYDGTIDRTYHYPDGSTSEVKVHPTRASYNKAKQFAEKQASLAEGTVWKSEPGQEFAEIRKDGEHLKVSGREFLTQVYVIYDAAATATIGSVGDRVMVRPLSPESIGGRIKRLAELYESHKALKFCVTYAPVVPATTPGALAMAYVSDVATTQQLTGVAEMVHLSTACDFVEFPVWETCVLPVDPDRFTREVADEQEGDARFTTDGMLIVLLAGPISNAGPGSLIFGNLFIEYEYDFSTPLLDQDVAAPVSGSVTVTAGAATTTVLGAAYAALGPVPGAYPSWGLTGLPFADTPDYLFTCTIQSIVVTTSLPVLRILDSETTFSMDVGQTFFCRVAVSSTGTDSFLFFFDSLEAASNFVFDQASVSGALTSGQVLTNAASAAGIHQYVLKMLMTAIDLSSNAVI